MMQINKTDMLAAVTLLAKIPIQEGVPTSELLKLTSANSKLILSATGGLNCQYRLKTGEKLKEIAVPRAPFCIFVDVARTLDTDTPFEITQQEKLLFVQHGRRLIKLPINEPTGNYGCSTDGKFNEYEDSETLRKRVTRCAQFAVDTPDQADLYCVYLASDGILAADRKSGICVKSGQLQEQFLPLKFAELYGEQTEGKLYVSNKLIQFRGPRFVFEQTLPADDKFPYEKFTRLLRVPQDADTVKFDAGALQSAISRYASFVSLASDNEKVIYLRLVKGNTFAKFSMHIGGSEVRENVKLAEKCNSDAEYRFAASYIAKFCANVNEKEPVSITTTAKSAIHWFKCGKTTFYLAKIQATK